LRAVTFSAEPLPNNGSGIHMQTHGLMKYTVELTSGAMIYIPSFITTNSGIQNLIAGGIHTHTDT
jgi:hypothetical protein